MKAIHSLLLTSVLAFFPASLFAAASPTVQAVTPLDVSSPVTEAYDQDENTINISMQHADSEEKEVQETSQETSSVEKGTTYEKDQEEEVATIPDPLAPFNEAMYHVNDKLYFWVLKPVTQVYSHIIPEPFRIVFSNVYDNLKSPGRVINNLLQLRFKAAGNELIRFLFNSTAGIGGLGDAAKDALGIKKQEADFGQTLGHYGVGHGFYLVLPVLGPSSLRDTVGLVGDRLMYPLTYVSEDDLSLGAAIGISAHEKINETSFRIGDYESFKESAVDPYVSMRDAFVQHRKEKIEKNESRSEEK
jgi:phospholipid-binding lipoprotein MlaA